jgi:hypothetical protein
MNLLHEAARTESNLISDLAILAIKGSVHKPKNHYGITYGLSGGDIQYHRHCLITDTVRDHIQDFGIDAGNILNNLLLESSDVDVRNRSQFVIDRFTLSIKYKQDFRNGWNSKARSIQYISDGITPTGNVHYLIVMSYDKNKGVYTSNRLKAADLSQDQIDGLEFKFDYFGPEEDIQGLIRNLDY